MKTLRIFAMASIAIFMGVSLASCSKDNGSGKDNHEEVAKEKKLKLNNYDKIR